MKPFTAGSSTMLSAIDSTVRQVPSACAIRYSTGGVPPGVSAASAKWRRRGRDLRDAPGTRTGAPCHRSRSRPSRRCAAGLADSSRPSGDTTKMTSDACCTRAVSRRAEPSTDCSAATRAEMSTRTPAAPSLSPDAVRKPTPQTSRWSPATSMDAELEPFTTEQSPSEIDEPGALLEEAEQAAPDKGCGLLTQLGQQASVEEGNDAVAVAARTAAPVPSARRRASRERSSLACRLAQFPSQATLSLLGDSPTTSSRVPPGVWQD